MSLKALVHLFAIFSGVLLLCVILILVLCWFLFTRNGGQRGVSFDIDTSGSKVVFSAEGEGGRDLYLLDLATKQVSRVTKTPLWESTPAFSPNGQTILYAGSAKPLSPTHLYTCSLDGSNTKQLTFGETTYDDNPRYSPDGTEIVFLRATRRRPYSMGGWTWDQWDVCKCRADGTQITRLTHEEYYSLYAPLWTPDGKSILYSNGSDAFLLDAHTGTRTPVPNVRYFPFIAPNGTEVGYITANGETYNYEVWLTDLNGKENRRITDTKAYNTYARFLPKGDSLLFLSDQKREERYELLQVDVDGKNLHRVADSSLFANPMRWKPK